MASPHHHHQQQQFKHHQYKKQDGDRKEEAAAEEEEEEMSAYLANRTIRQDVRRRLSKLLEDITRRHKQDLVVEEDQKQKQKLYSLMLQQAQEVFHRDIVKTGNNVRELNLDAVIQNELSLLLKMYFERSVSQASSHSVDFGTFMRHMKKQYVQHVEMRKDDAADSDNTTSNTKLDFSLLGREMMMLFSKSHSITALHGPLKKELKQKVLKRPMKATEDLGKTETAKQELHAKDDDDHNDVSAARVKHMVSDLQDRLDPHKKKRVENCDLLRYLVDPKDTLKTVENFFDFAFLLKEKQVEEHIDRETSQPVIQLASQHHHSIPEKKQFIVSLNIGELEELQRLLYPQGNPESHPLQRTGIESELYNCVDVKEQIAKIKERK